VRKWASVTGVVRKLAPVSILDSVAMHALL
jgi:hypothetical protein